MNTWHRRFLTLQIWLLFAILCVMSLLNPSAAFLLPAVSFFIVLEIGVLEKQRIENQSAVYYRKSCFFALIDLISVVCFLIWYGSLFHSYFSGLPAVSAGVWLILYAGARKLYILKNYSYEK